jgi:hypothetical protein
MSGMYCELSMMTIFMLMICYILYDLGDGLWCSRSIMIFIMLMIWYGLLYAYVLVWSAICLCSGMICYMLMFCYDLQYAYVLLWSVLYDLGVYGSYDLWLSWISYQAAMAAVVGASSDAHRDISRPSLLVHIVAMARWHQPLVATDELLVTGGWRHGAHHW